MSAPSSDTAPFKKFSRFRSKRRVMNRKIPIDRLSPEALQGVIEEFISRAGTDYGETEVSWDAMFHRVKQNLETGSAVLLYDDETETTNIFLATDPILRKLDSLTE